MWFWRRLFFTFSVLTVSFGLGLDLDSNLFGLGLDSDSNLFGLGLDSDSNLFGLGLVLDSTKVDLTTALLLEQDPPFARNASFASGVNAPLDLSKDI